MAFRIFIRGGSGWGKARQTGRGDLRPLRSGPGLDSSLQPSSKGTLFSHPRRRVPAAFLWNWAKGTWVVMQEGSDARGPGWLSHCSVMAISL